MEEVHNLLTLDEAHAGFEKAVLGVDMALINEVRGHSLWQLLEHIRIGQADILKYIEDAQYTHDLSWPDDYWPKNEGSADDWRESVAKFRKDHKRIVGFVKDIGKTVPSNSKHTILRELLLVADHNAYHIGQMVLVRKLLGMWT